MLGYPVVVIPCGHHCVELIPKHMVRLLTGRTTTGPGEVLFLNFHAAQNEVRDLVRADTVLKRFSYEDYSGTPVFDAAEQVLDWGSAALAHERYSRGDYMQHFSTHNGLDTIYFNMYSQGTC